jgi:alpha-D-ribose 1-methylphosphonate 5-triphosphate synthase subunit PhnG
MSATTAMTRADALRLLALAEPTRLDAVMQSLGPEPAHEVLRPAETGLVMVQGRVGGGGGAFNLGEASVSRASVRLKTGEEGHGYCLGRDSGKARQIALCDALFQRDPASVTSTVLVPLATELAAADARRRAETAATQVDFFTLVRGDD